MKSTNRTAKNIWMLAREYGDLAGAGGVKDVADQLSRALAEWTGRKVSVVLPLYGFLDPAEMGFAPLPDPEDGDRELSFEVDMNYAAEERRESLKVWHKRSDKVNLYLLDGERFREKQDVYTYTAAEAAGDPFKVQGEGHFDYFAVNLLLQKGTLQLLLMLQEKPDVIHCHDGHTAVLPAIVEETPWLRSYFRNTGFVVTVHNAGIGYHQEVYDLPYARAMTGLPWQVILDCRLRDGFDPLVAAGSYALVNTVSENYAKELQGGLDDELTGWLGHHLLDMGVKLEGITNGIDPKFFDPSLGELIGLAEPFAVADNAAIGGKKKCRKALLDTLTARQEMNGVRQYGVVDGDRQCPLFTFIGRFSHQKGVDILHDAVSRLVKEEHDFQIVILGSGKPVLESDLIELAERGESRGKVCFLEGFSPRIANKIYSAGDFFLVPSRYEPCGLTDFIAQLFGNIPIVHHVGGLVKVIEGETGFVYSGNSGEALAQAMTRAMEAFRDPGRIRRMQKEAVRLIEKKYTWKEVKNKYLQLYKKAILKKTAES